MERYDELMARLEILHQVFSAEVARQKAAGKQIFGGGVIIRRDGKLLISVSEVWGEYFEDLWIAPGSQTVYRTARGAALWQETDPVN